jgi:inorganic pyrophosphatase
MFWTRRCLSVLNSIRFQAADQFGKRVGYRVILHLLAPDLAVFSFDEQRFTSVASHGNANQSDRNFLSMTRRASLRRRGNSARLRREAGIWPALSKSLILGLSYPYDWGFIPSTEGEDGDPIDALILHEAATTPGLVLKCKIIGVLEVVQTEGGKNAIRNDRVIAVPRDSHREQANHDARDLPKQARSEIEKFFVATDELESKELKFLGWKGRKTAERLIEKATKRFQKANGKNWCKRRHYDSSGKRKGCDWADDPLAPSVSRTIGEAAIPADRDIPV